MIGIKATEGVRVTTDHKKWLINLLQRRLHGDGIEPTAMFVCGVLQDGVW